MEGDMLDMSNTNLRLFQMNTPIDVTTDTDMYINSGVNAYNGQFVTSTGNETSRAAVFDENNFIIAPDDKSLDFGTGYFLIAFWLKFAEQPSSADDITLALYFEDDSVVMTELPILDWIESGYYVKETIDKESNTFYYRSDQIPDFDTTNPTSLTPSETLTNIDWTIAHYISIVRSNEGITFRCDGNIFGIDHNDSEFNLTSKSLFVMDSLQEDSPSNTPIIDDLVLSNEDIQSISTTPPSNYIAAYSVDPTDIPWTPIVISSNILKVY